MNHMEIELYGNRIDFVSISDDFVLEGNCLGLVNVCKHAFELDPEDSVDLVREWTTELLRQLKEGAEIAAHDIFTAKLVLDPFKDETISDVIAKFVPAEYYDLFVRNGDKDWWSWKLELDNEDSVGTHVHNLIPLAYEMLNWMQDASKETIESHWQAVAEQCLTWAFG